MKKLVVLVTILLSASLLFATPHRIISLSPAVTEILFAIGAGPQLIADTTQCDYPPPAKSLPKIGAFLNPTLETIVAHHPDLMIGMGYEDSPKQLTLQQLKVPAVWLKSPKSLPDIYTAILTLGAATGHKTEAKILLRQLQHTLVPAPLHHRPKVLLLVWAPPLIAASSSSYLSELITLAGGQNVIYSRIGYPKISPEILIAQNPDLILVTDKTFIPVLTHLSGATRCTAIRTHRIITLPPDALLRPGPRLGEGLIHLKAAINP